MGGGLKYNFFFCRLKANSVFCPLLFSLQDTSAALSLLHFHFSSFAKLDATCPFAVPTVQNCVDITTVDSILLSSTVIHSTSIF